MKKLGITSVVSICLLASASLAFAQNGTDKDNKIVNQSATAKEISLTVDNYSIKDNTLTVNYTVKAAGNYDLEPRGLVERADVFIAGKLTHPKSQSHKKVSEGKYTGSSNIDLPSNLPDQYDVKFNTDSVLNQEGQWTVNFKVQ